MTDEQAIRDAITERWVARADAAEARCATLEAAIASALTSLATGPGRDGYAYSVLEEAVGGKPADAATHGGAMTLYIIEWSDGSKALSCLLRDARRIARDETLPNETVRIHRVTGLHPVPISPIKEKDLSDAHSQSEPC